MNEKRIKQIQVQLTMEEWQRVVNKSHEYGFVGTPNVPPRSLHNAKWEEVNGENLTWVTLDTEQGAGAGWASLLLILFILHEEFDTQPQIPIIKLLNSYKKKLEKP